MKTKEVKVQKMKAEEIFRLFCKLDKSIQVELLELLKKANTEKLSNGDNEMEVRL